MAIDAKMIKELRDKTGMGITNCKKALEETGGDLEKAEMLLRKQGIDKAAKKADRPMGEGAIAAKLSDDGKAGVLVEMSCEQEPTTNNDRFRALVGLALDTALENKAQCAKCLLAATTPDGTMQDSVTQLVAVVGENVQLRRAACLEAPANGLIGSYVHFNKKAGALCVLTLEGIDPSNEAMRTLANDICMHAVACRPAALDRASLPADLVEKEKEVFRDQVKDKPENIQEKILEGKLGKFYAEKCLTEQIFVKDPDGKKSVTETVNETAKAQGGKAAISGFVRFELGL